MADRYWVGGSATWDATVGTKWATTSGGGGGSAVPTSADNVFINAASGANTVTVSGSRACANLDCTGFTGTLAGVSVPLIAVSGTVITLGTGMTFASTGPRLQGQAAVTITLTTNGKTIQGITVGFAGCTMLFADNVTSGAAIILTSGTINANNKNVSCGALFLTGTIARTMTMGSGAWTIGGASGSFWDSTTTTNLTYTAGSATITFTPSTTTASDHTIVLGTVSLAANAVTIAANANSGARLALAGTFGTINASGPTTFMLSGALTMTGGTWTGTSSSWINLKSSAIGTQQTLTTSGAITGSYVTCMDILKAGAGSITLTHGLDLGNNSGVTIRTRLLPRATNMMAV